MQINAKAAEILGQIVVGQTKLGMVGRADIPADLVVSISEKSVHFADGTHTNKRSLHRFYIAG